MLHKKRCGYFTVFYGNSSDLYLPKNKVDGII